MENTMIKEIGGLLVHPIANIMPMMSVIELDALVLDINANGLREPIWMFKKNGEDYIIDGRNRAIACNKIGVIPEYRYYDGNEESLLNFVISLNISRRHLNSGQRACLAVDILPMIEAQNEQNRINKISKSRSTGEASGKGEKSRDIAAKIFSVSGKYISNAKRLKNDNNLFEQVKSGVLTLSKALTLLEKSETVEIIPPSEDLIKISKPQPILTVAPITLTRADSRKVEELVQLLGVSEQKATEFILSKKKPKSTAKPKSSFSNRIEFKVDESEKELLMNLAKQKGISLSEMLREVVKSIK